MIAPPPSPRPTPSSSKHDCFQQEKNLSDLVVLDELAIVDNHVVDPLREHALDLEHVVVRRSKRRADLGLVHALAKVAVRKLVPQEPRLGAWGLGCFFYYY
jgi:hypothetical protein